MIKIFMVITLSARFFYPDIFSVDNYKIDIVSDNKTTICNMTSIHKMNQFVLSNSYDLENNFSLNMTDYNLSDYIYLNTDKQESIFRFCPDNTCNVLVINDRINNDSLVDLGVLYLYYFSEYIYLKEWRGNDKVSEKIKNMLLRYGCNTGNDQDKAVCVINKILNDAQLSLFFIRYDESGCFMSEEQFVFEYITANDEWRRNDENRYFSVQGDFNGDGKDDQAQLGISNDGKKLVLIALLNLGQNKFKQYVLSDDMDSAYKDIMGIRLLKSGTYETVCSKGYFDCNATNNLPITFDFDVIEFFKYDGISSVFYWDKNSNNFNRLWLSD